MDIFSLSKIEDTGVTLKHYFLESLSEIQKSKAILFWEKQSFVSVEQHADWIYFENDKRNINFLMVEEKDEIVAFCVIHIRKTFLLKIIFGPVATNPVLYNLSIQLILKNYRNKFLLFSIQSPYPATDSEACTLALNFFEKNKISYITHVKSTWSTIMVDLANDLAQIYAAFRINHKRNIKKADRLGIAYELITSAEDAETLAKIYIDMYKYRRLKVNEKRQLAFFKSAHAFFKDSGNGFMMGIWYNGILVGGQVITYQGKSAFYAKGAINSTHRDIPLMHGAFKRSISKSMDEGIRFFDFGGYNLYASPHSQIDKINNFKKGFGGTIVSYCPRVVVFRNKPMRLLYKLFIFLRINIY